MKNLVISVSPDSSLELLRQCADVVVLDADVNSYDDSSYDTVYIRSHFSKQETLPQNYRTEIDEIVRRARNASPNLRFIDGMKTVDQIVEFEDKWHQYALFGTYMPKTELYSDNYDAPSFARPIYKKRLSSRGSGVTWDKGMVVNDKNGDWLIQESLDIKEELRIYIIHGEVHPIGAIKQSMTEGVKAESVQARALSQDEVDFSLHVMELALGLDFVGIDVARTTAGSLSLMEVNRSPGFAKFYELSGTNLADTLYGLNHTASQ